MKSVVLASVVKQICVLQIRNKVQFIILKIKEESRICCVWARKKGFGGSNISFFLC